MLFLPFISQHLTDYIYLGGLPHLGKRLDKIADILRILKASMIKLERSLSHSPVRLFRY
jgi:hypothetical protein